MDFGDDIHADQNLEAILHRLYNGDYLSVEEAELFDNDANPSTIEHLSILDLVPRPIVEDKLRWNGPFLQGSADSDLVHGIDSPRFVKTDVLYRDIVKSQHTPNKQIRNVHNSNGKAQWDTGGNEYTRENNGIDVRPDNVDSWLMEGDAIHQVQGRTAQERQWNTMVANEFISRDVADVWERKTGHSKRAKDSTFQGRDSRSQREYDEDSEELEKDVDSKGPCMSDDDSGDVEIDATDNTNYYDNVKTSGEDNSQRVTTPRTTKNTRPLAVSGFTLYIILIITDKYRVCYLNNKITLLISIINVILIS